MIGQTLGQYRIAAEVARGGQATVYRATHQVLGRDVALKVLHPHLITFLRSPKENVHELWVMQVEAA